MAKDTSKADTTRKGAIAQAASKAPTKAAAAGDDAPARPRVGPFKFAQQVRQEVAKVTWPSQRETMVTTIMVLIMVVLSAIFFFLVDWILGSAVRWFLGLGV